MTQTEFLLDTLQYYCEDTSRRCEKDGRCKYHPSSINHSNSEGCAIGRHLPEELALKCDSDGAIGVDIIFNELPDNLRLLGRSFLDDIQCLHDVEIYWNTSSGKGLLEAGQHRLKTIILNYALDETLFTEYLN